MVYLGKSCIAFAAIENLKAEGIPVLYLSGLVVKAEYQGNGLMKKLITYEVKESKPKILAARTQNPCILDLMKGFCKKDALYPYSGIPQEKCRLVSDFLSLRFLKMKNFNPKTLIDIGTYGRCLYRNGVPKSYYQESNDFFERINSKRGDSILFVGEVNYEE